MKFEGDVFGSSKLGYAGKKEGFGGVRPYGWILLSDNLLIPEQVDEQEKMKMVFVEDRKEISYIDFVELVFFQHDASVLLVEENPARNDGRIVKHVRDSILPVPEVLMEFDEMIFIEDEYLEDVRSTLLSKDGEWLILGDSRTSLSWRFIELSFPILGMGEEMYVVLHAASDYPEFVTEEFLELRGFEGNSSTQIWIRCPSSFSEDEEDWKWKALNLKHAVPPEYPRTMILDLGKMPCNTSRIKLGFVTKTHIDSISYSLFPSRSKMAEIKSTSVQIKEAELVFQGVNVWSGTEVTDEWIYSPSNKSYGTGRGKYTRYGRVSELVKSEDDRSVIMASGDALWMTFIPPSPKEGKRTVALQGTAWYKAQSNVALEWIVDPIPYRGMSEYPYESVELDWDLEWNTRVVGDQLLEKDGKRMRDEL
jgi:hypothetical protein